MRRPGRGPVGDREVSCHAHPEPPGRAALAALAVAAVCGGEPPARRAARRGAARRLRVAAAGLATRRRPTRRSTSSPTTARSGPAHDGRLSEHFLFAAGPGSSFYLQLPLAEDPGRPTGSRRPCTSGRTGPGCSSSAGWCCRPTPTRTRASRRSSWCRGRSTTNVDRWQRLEIDDCSRRLERQARVLRASTRRPVSLEGAYVERLVVNLYAGPGETEVFLDDLTVGPVPGGAGRGPRRALAAGGRRGRRRSSRQRPGRPFPGPSPPPPRGPGRRNRLKRRVEDGLYTTGSSRRSTRRGRTSALLRKAGFDVLVDDIEVRPGTVAGGGLSGVPARCQGRVRGARRRAARAGAERIPAAASSFPFAGPVAAWHLGDKLGRADDPRIRGRAGRSGPCLGGSGGFPPGVAGDDRDRRGRPRPCTPGPPGTLTSWASGPTPGGRPGADKDTFRTSSSAATSPSGATPGRSGRAPGDPRRRGGRDDLGPRRAPLGTPDGPAGTAPDVHIRRAHGGIPGPRVRGGRRPHPRRGAGCSSWRCRS